jgi:hypothetical protein
MSIIDPTYVQSDISFVLVDTAPVLRTIYVKKPKLHQFSRLSIIETQLKLAQ